MTSNAIILVLIECKLKRKLNINSYQERWRDWPYEAQQPVLNVQGAKSCNYLLVDR